MIVVYSGVTTICVQFSNLDQPWRLFARSTVGISSRKKSVNGDKIISPTRIRKLPWRQESSLIGCILSRNPSKIYSFLLLPARKSALRVASMSTLVLAPDAENLADWLYGLVERLNSFVAAGAVLDVKIGFCSRMITALSSVDFKNPSTIVMVK